jgi:hypothetical protein
MRRPTAGCRFFQRLPHRLGADLVDQAEHDQLVGEQLQGPVAAALGGLTASQFDQPLLDVPLDLDLVGPRGLRSAQQGHVDPCGDQFVAHAGDGSQAGAQGSDDLVVGPFVAEGVVGQQKDAGMGQLARRGLAAGNQLFQVGPLRGGQRNSVLVHVAHPALGASPLPNRQESGYRLYLPNED